MSRHYLIAYGSLMSTESRGKTGMLGRSWPVVLSNVRVGWANVYPSVTYMGAEEKKGYNALGVMFEVPPDKDPMKILGQFDKREGAKYIRTRLSLGKIDVWRPKDGTPPDAELPWKKDDREKGVPDDYSGESEPLKGKSKIEAKPKESTRDPATNNIESKGEPNTGAQADFKGDGGDGAHHVWIYVLRSWQKRSNSSYVLQSYVDVVLAGGLEYHEEFAREWAKKCQQWIGTVKADRHEPCYPRGLRALPEELATKIDSMLPTDHLKARRRRGRGSKRCEIQ
ncbi:hypothetical protein AAMO2058_000662500 [Amorphochlora amoebiformis]